MRVADRPACAAASSTGVRSAPPPNQALVVTTKRVFMCTAGTCGLCGCAISEMPDAQKRGSASAPGMSLRNSGANSPNTVETCTPTFSNTRPFIIDMTPPPPGGAGVIAAAPGRAHEPAGGVVRRVGARRSAARPRAPRTPCRCRRAGARTRRARGTCARRGRNHQDETMMRCPLDVIIYPTLAARNSCRTRRSCRGAR